MIWPGKRGLLACVLLVIAQPFLEAQPAQHSPAQLSPGEADSAKGGPSLQDAKLAFFETLFVFRANGLESDEALVHAAGALALAMGDGAAQRIADYYRLLSPRERREGFDAEERFDAIRGTIHGADLERVPSTPRQAHGRELPPALTHFIEGAHALADLVPAAHGESLAARLTMRELEHSWPRGEAGVRKFRARARGAETSAVFAISTFERAGMATPQLEPEWILARLALIEGDVSLAERHFHRMGQLAAAAGQNTWRERAQLGLIGVARERGSPTAAAAALAELATFRDPGSCWALSREVAVERLGRDDPDGAIQWLEQHGPRPAADHEIDAARADEEWVALLAAAHLRARRPFEARQLLETIGAAGERSEGNGRRTLLLRAALQLEFGDPEGALETLASPEAIHLPAVDVRTLRGRAYLAAGRTAEAIFQLESALAAAAERDARDRRALIDASAVGEWLGLSAVADLAKAYLIGEGDALGAAAAIEAAHAGITVNEARTRLLAAAQTVDLGVITWVVGADTTLMVQVERSGRATHRIIPTGRAAMSRAIRRIRQGIEGTRNSPESDRQDDQLQELSAALLPLRLSELVGTHAASGQGAPSLILMPHGALERLPFEALPIGGDSDSALGTEVSLAIVSELKSEAQVAARVDLRKTDWAAVGAPDFLMLPDLEGSRKELASLGQMNPRMSVFAGAEGTREALTRALRGTCPVHVSSHVVPLRAGLELGDTGRATGPSERGVAMSGGEVMTAADLAAAGPRLPLLVLAACATGEGDSLDGASVRGIAQVALDTGTRCALLTQWPVSDEAAYRASLAFHGALLTGAPPAEAARRARSLLRKTGRTMAEWAAYRVSGAW